VQTKFLLGLFSKTLKELSRQQATKEVALLNISQQFCHQTLQDEIENKY
jgi:hypothetical protein